MSATWNPELKMGRKLRRARNIIKRYKDKNLDELPIHKARLLRAQAEILAAVLRKE